MATRHEEAYGPKVESPCRPRAEALATLEGPILDVACGPGFELALFPDGVGIDSSPGMLAEARRRAPGAKLVLGDVRALPFRAGVFAGAFSCLALIHLTKAELASTLSELHVLLRADAPAIAVFFAGTGEREATFSPLSDTATAHYAFYQADELSEVFRRAGFADVTVEDDVLNEPARPGIPCLSVSAQA